MFGKIDKACAHSSSTYAKIDKILSHCGVSNKHIFDSNSAVSSTFTG